MCSDVGCIIIVRDQLQPHMLGLYMPMNYVMMPNGLLQSKDPDSSKLDDA